MFVEEEVYRNVSTPKSLALIINNKKFVKGEERTGTKIDEKNIRNLFTQMGYEFKETLHNLTGMEMLTAAREFAAEEAHKDYDSCAVFVFTHGNYDGLWGRDNNHDKGRVNLHDLLGCFNSMNAPLLSGKPKLFFLQACRGTKYDYGTDTTDSLFSCLKSMSLQTKEAISPSQPSEVSKKQYAAYHALHHGISRQPVESDMLIAYATPPNYVSWRNAEDGSWFIQAICEIFCIHSANKDIGSLLTKVHERVAKEYISSKNGQKQIPEFVSRLRKKFYFFPGIQM